MFQNRLCALLSYEKCIIKAKRNEMKRLKVLSKNNRNGLQRGSTGSYESFCNPYIVSFLCFPVAVLDKSSPSEFKSSRVN